MEVGVVGKLVLEDIQNERDDQRHPTVSSTHNSIVSFHNAFLPHRVYFPPDVKEMLPVCSTKEAEPLTAGRAGEYSFLFHYDIIPKSY